METIKSGFETSAKGERKYDAETEPYFPLIDQDEASFIENTGGEYRGFIAERDGSKMFGEFWIDRRAHYDESERQVIETFIATDAMNEENDDELTEPSEVKAFRLMIVRKSRSGQELGRPEIISLQPRDFPEHLRNTPELRALAHELHNFVAQNAESIPYSKLRQELILQLQSKGWRGQ